MKWGSYKNKKGLISQTINLCHVNYLFDKNYYQVSGKPKVHQIFWANFDNIEYRACVFKE